MAGGPLQPLHEKVGISSNNHWNGDIDTSALANRRNFSDSRLGAFILLIISPVVLHNNHIEATQFPALRASNRSSDVRR